MKNGIMIRDFSNWRACAFLMPIRGGAPEPVVVSWLPDDAPAELRSDPTLANYKTASEAGKALLEAKAKISQKGVIVPPEGTKHDAPEMIEYLKKIGRPDDAKGYELPTVTLPNGMQMNVAEVEAFKEKAFAAGMTKKQFKEIFGYRIDTMIKEANDQSAAATAARQASETKLRNEFGAKYDERVQGVQKLVNAYAKDGEKDVVDLLNANPAAIALLGRILDDMSEASIEKIGHTRTGAFAPDEAKAKISEIWADANHAFHKPELGKKHLEAKAEMDKLYQMAHGAKK